MKTGTIIFWAFWAMVVIQLGLPLRTAWQHESALRNGTAYRFPTVPVDPNDPFRGKYVTLGFSALEEVLTQSELQEVARTVEVGQEVFLVVTKDDQDYVRAQRITALAPSDGDEDYFAARVRHINYPQTDSARMLLEYPFNRFYLEEFKAPAAEERYRDAMRDTTADVYALVRIQNGVVVLEDVVINGESITE